jgi:hypothetical protein
MNQSVTAEFVRRLEDSIEAGDRSKTLSSPASRQRPAGETLLLAATDANEDNRADK